MKYYLRLTGLGILAAFGLGLAIVLFIQVLEYQRNASYRYSTPATVTTECTVEGHRFDCTATVR